MVPDGREHESVVVHTGNIPDYPNSALTIPSSPGRVGNLSAPSDTPVDSGPAVAAAGCFLIITVDRVALVEYRCAAETGAM